MCVVDLDERQTYLYFPQEVEPGGGLDLLRVDEQEEGEQYEHNYRLPLEGNTRGRVGQLQPENGDIHDFEGLLHNYCNYFILYITRYNSLVQNNCNYLILLKGARAQEIGLKST